MKRRLFFLSAIALLTFKLVSQIPTASLVGYWPFDGNANDYSGNSNNGTVNGATLTVDRFGNANRAYSFNGISNNIVVPNSTSIDMTNSTDFSIAFWENTYSSPNSDASMISKNSYGSQSGYMFFSNSTNSGYCNTAGQLSFYAAAGSGGDACANNAIATGTNLNTWIFIVGVYDATLNQAYLYVNGVLQTDVGSRSGSMSTSVPLTFGSHPSNLGYFKGALDDIRIYKTKLTQAQITALYTECGAVPATPLNTTGSVTICSGNTSTLSASGSTVYNWYASSTSTTALANSAVYVTPTLSAGTYTYYVENAACTFSAALPRVAITLTVNSNPTLSVSNGTVCSGQSFTLNPSGATTYSYSCGVAVVNPVSSTVYTISGTTNGCTKTTTASVFVNPLPVITIASGSICSGQSFSLSPSGASTYTVSGGSVVVAPISTTNYTVTGTSGAGCISSQPAIATVVVHQGPAISVANGVICSGQSYTFVPTGALNFSISGGSYIVSPVNSSTYILTGDNGNGCLSSTVVSVTVNQLPVISISGNNYLCQGSSVTLLAGGSAASYSWSNGTNSNLVLLSPNVTTVYSVTATDANNCSAIAMQTVVVYPLPLVGALSSASAVCAGNQIVLTGTGAITYSWTNGVINNQSFVPSSTGSYTVTGTDANGCKNSATISVLVKPGPILHIVGSNSVICSGQTTTLLVSGANAYSWNTGSTDSVLVINPLSTTVYTVTGTNVNACSSSNVYTQNVDACLGLSTVDSNGLIQIYPNPFRNEFSVQTNQDSEITILNALGQVILTQHITSGENKVDLIKYAGGIYFVQVKQGSVLKLLKLVKE